MPKQKTNNQNANQYDKIFRENMEQALPGVIEHLLGLNIVHSEEIPDDIQHTKERKPDLLKKVTDSAGKVFILHIEFQVQNDKQMIYRMAEYRIMLLRKYELAVKQFVIFVGSGKMRMASEINEERLAYSYQLINISDVSYKIFLKSDKPEQKILAILGNFESDSSDLALTNIVKSVGAKAKGDLTQSRYFQQLRIFAQLRTLDIKLEKVMDVSLAKIFKVEKDPFFQRGKSEGKIEQAIATAVKMKKAGFPFPQISKFTGLSVGEIEKL